MIISNRNIFLLVLMFSLSLYGCGELLTNLGLDNATHGSQGDSDRPNSGGGSSTGGNSGNDNGSVGGDDSGGTEDGGSTGGDTGSGGDNGGGTTGGGDSGGTTGGGSTGGDTGSGGDNGGGTTGGGDSGGTEGGGSTGGDTGSGGDNGGGEEKPISTILAGTRNGLVGHKGGIYYSKDNGLTWSESVGENGLDLGKTLWLDFVDLGDNVVLAGSGEITNPAANDDIIRKKGQGIIISRDAGVSWNKTNMTVGQWPSLAYLGNNIVVSGTNSEDISQGIYRSEDGGITWERNRDDNYKAPSIFDGDKTLGVGITLIPSPLFLAIDNSTVIAHRNYSFPGDSFNPIIISFDTGKTWFRIADKPNTTTIFAFLKKKNGDLILGAGTYKGIYVSFNNSFVGRFWESLGISGPSFTSLIELKSGSVLAGSANDNTAAHSAASGIWRSAVGGMLQGSYSQSNMQRFTWKGFAALDDGGALAGCADEDKSFNIYCTGIWKSYDDGISWAQINDINIQDKLIFSMETVR